MTCSENVKTSSYCIGSRRYFSTVNVVDKKTSQKKFIRNFVECIRKKLMTVKDITIAAEGLGMLFKKIGKSSVKTGKKLAENELKNSERAPKIGGDNGTAAVSKSLKASLSTIPNVLKFYHNGKRLHLGKFVKIQTWNLFQGI